MENSNNIKESKGKLIVLEGADGSGRSTQIAGLRDWLERNGFAVEEVGLKRSQLVAEELEKAKEGNVLCPITMSLFYATDFADQMENLIIPALHSGFIVLADRYIYTLMARAIVRGIDADWIRDVYSFAIPPDAIFYLEVSPKELAERNFRKNATLDYWESGMDMRQSLSMYENFIRYQKKLQKIFHQMQQVYPFKTINGNRSPKVILQELQANIRTLLNLEIDSGKHKSEEAR
jgi:dTMP kinase